MHSTHTYANADACIHVCTYIHTYRHNRRSLSYLEAQLERLLNVHLFHCGQQALSRRRSHQKGLTTTAAETHQFGKLPCSHVSHSLLYLLGATAFSSMINTLSR